MPRRGFSIKPPRPMKKTLLFASAAVLLCGCGTGSKYVVEGHIAGLEGTVYMFEGDSLIDSAVVEGGKFRFEGPADITARRTVTDGRTANYQTCTAQFIPEPGTISVFRDADDAGVLHATGTPVNDAFDAYLAADRALMKEIHDTATTEGRCKEIEEEFDRLAYGTVRDNRTNFLGVIAMAEMIYSFSGERVLEEIAAFSPEMQRTDELAGMKAIALQKIRMNIGQPDIVQNDAEGQPLSLGSVIGNPANKCTLVDFWASWCRPCMGEVPYLKDTYEKFHGKGFEIYGISFDNDREKWLRAVENNGMNWIQVSDLNGYDNSARQNYAVAGIPANYLIDAQGKIVAKNLRGEALNAKIEELLGK